MKTIRLILLLLVVAGVIYAGSYGWNTDPADDPRILEAFGSIMNKRDANGSPVPATQREVSAAAMNWVNQQTTDYERRKNMAQYTPPPFATSPTPSPSPNPSPTVLEGRSAQKKK
jgi:hypothetical protein